MHRTFNRSPNLGWEPPKKMRLAKIADGRWVCHDVPVEEQQQQQQHGDPTQYGTRLDGLKDHSSPLESNTNPVPVSKKKSKKRTDELAGVRKPESAAEDEGVSLMQRDLEPPRGRNAGDRNSPEDRVEELVGVDWFDRPHQEVDLGDTFEDIVLNAVSMAQSQEEKRAAGAREVPEAGQRVDGDGDDDDDDSRYEAAVEGTSVLEFVQSIMSCTRRRGDPKPTPRV